MVASRTCGLTVLATPATVVKHTLDTHPMYLTVHYTVCYDRFRILGLKRASPIEKDVWVANGTL